MLTKLQTPTFALIALQTLQDLVQGQTWTNLFDLNNYVYPFEDESFFTGTENHLTSLTMFKNTNTICGSYVHGFQLNGQGDTVPTDPVTDDVLQTLSLTFPQRITEIRFYHYSYQEYGYGPPITCNPICQNPYTRQTFALSFYFDTVQVKIFLNDATVHRFGTPSTASTCSDTTSTLSIDTCNYELKGLRSVAGNQWFPGHGLIPKLQYYLESSVPGITISLSNIDAQTKNLISDTTTTNLSPIVAGDTMCTLTFSFAVVPNSTLITYSATKFSFAPSTDTTLAMAYQVFLYAVFNSQVVASSMATFTYVNPCSQTTLTWLTSLSTMSQSVGSTTVVTQTAPVVIDAVSSSKTTTGLCGAVTYSISSTLLSATTALTSTEVTISSLGLIQVQTSNSLTIGTHTVTVTESLSSYPAVLSPSTFVLTILCGVTSVQIVQFVDNGVLVQQAIQIPSTTAFSYPLSVVQSPLCGASATAWTIGVTSSDNPAQITSFQTISPSGVYSAGSFPGISQVGTYVITVTSVTLNGLSVTTMTGTNSFSLVVTADPCSLAVVTAPAAINIIVVVYDAVASYGGYSAFTYTSSSGSSACGTFSYSVAITPISSIQPTTFAIDSTNMNFQVLSANFNQVGVYTATLTGFLTNYVAATATTSFTVTVVDPCLTTTLSWPTILSAMSQSVGSQTVVTQSAPAVTDAVSTSQTQPGICGGFTYSISRTPLSATTALTSSEVSISQSGVISVSTTNSAAIGTHTVTVTESLSNYPTVFSTQAFTLTISSCVLTSVAIAQVSDNGALAAQTYTLSSTTQFLYALSVVQGPSCGYPVTAWTISVTSSDNAAKVTSFQTISSAGVYSAGPFSGISEVGTYVITVTAVTLNALSVTTMTGTNSFSLAVTADPCISAVVAASAATSINVVVYAAVASYGTFSAFTYTSPSGPSACGTFSYSALITPIGSITPTTFAIDTTNMNFQVSSANLNQVGVYTATLTGFLTNYVAATATTFFTVTVVDPCLTTSLTWPTSLAAMSQSVGQTTPATQTAPVVTDAVSISYTTPGLCGVVTFSISSTPLSATTALTSSEVTISSLGIIAVLTSINAEIGTHTVTVTESLSSYSAVLSNQAFTLTIQSCVLTSVSIAQVSDNGALEAQTYTLSSTTEFLYALKVLQSPNCGLTVTSWTVTTASQNNPPQVGAFQTISTSGVYSAGPSSRPALVGIYTVQITSVTIGGVSQTTFSGASSFNLTVVDPLSQAAQFQSVNQQFSSTYLIGALNTPLNLKSHYTIQPGFALGFIEPICQSGCIPASTYYVDSLSLQFIINLSDPTFNATSSVFQFQAMLTNGQTNTDVTLTVNYQIATASQIAARSRPPKFSSVPQTPLTLPCFSFNSAMRWNYTLPKAVNFQQEQISYGLTCSSVDSSVFIVTVIQGSLTLTLNTVVASGQPKALSFPCTITLTNTFNKTTSYKVLFDNACNQTNTFAGTNTAAAKLLYPPFPTIASIDSYGKVIISWNVSLLVPANITTQNNWLAVMHQKRVFNATMLRCWLAQFITHLKTEIYMAWQTTNLKIKS